MNCGLISSIYLHNSVFLCNLNVNQLTGVRLPGSEKFDKKTHPSLPAVCVCVCVCEIIPKPDNECPIVPTYKSCHLPPPTTHYCVCVVLLCMCAGHTNSLRCENLGESGRECDEDYRVGDPGQVLQKHITVQTTVHPLLCCGHTQIHTRKQKQGRHVNYSCNTNSHKFTCMHVK